MFSVASVLVLVAAAANGMLAGASLDQSIKQLPARRRIGAAAYAVYARAADGGNGIAWYAILGVGTAVITILAAALVYLNGYPIAKSLPLYVAVALTIVHSFATVNAAPIMLSLRRAPDDEASLKEKLDRFEKWQTLRVLFQVLTFAVMMWAFAVSTPG